MPFRDDYRVLDISQKGAKGNAEQRRQLLERVAKQVQPVMKKHKWSVQLLSELPPTSRARLWGLNIGGGGGSTKEIKIRLIEFECKDQYLPYEAILGTMLHELCHNEFGPHNADFYRLLDDITLELEDFMAKGITVTGEGFDAPSVGRLGGAGFGSHNVSLTELRGRMVQAAEFRAKRAGLMPAGPRKLGGSALSHLTPREAAAVAAERRARDDAGCGCGAKGGTSFTDAEVIELESQPSSANVHEQKGKQAAATHTASHTDPHKLSRTGVGTLDGTDSSSRPQQHDADAAKQLDFKKGLGVWRDEEQKYSMQKQEEAIDLTADSDIEPEVLD